MKLRIAIYGLLLFIVTAVGCPARPYHTWYDLPTPNEMVGKDIIAVCGNKELVPFMDAWAREAARRYDNFILIFVHGDSTSGEWYAVPDEPGPVPVEKIIKQYREKFGETRRVVLVMCNFGHVRLNTPGVTYARDGMWGRPDSLVSTFQNTFRDSIVNNVGDIFELVENPSRD